MNLIQDSLDLYFDDLSLSLYLPFTQALSFLRSNGGLSKSGFFLCLCCLAKKMKLLNVIHVY